MEYQTVGNVEAEPKTELEKRVDRIDMLCDVAVKIYKEAQQTANRLYGLEPKEVGGDFEAAPERDGLIPYMDRRLDWLERTLRDCQSEVARLSDT